MTIYEARYQQYLTDLETALPLYLPEQPREKGGLPVEAARYSLLGGGKRVRPVLLLAFCDLLGVERPAAMPFACALEMIHTYSLIHDDLPCMDDDDLRRGHPTCHRAYGEAVAILAGDTLLNRACEILLATVSLDLPGSLQAARLIAAAAGSKGMIGGQALDLAAEGKSIQLEDLRQIHKLKTGALIMAPVMAAACLAGASSEITMILENFASAIGLAFQIQDDILDVTADTAALGKSTGKDQRDQKSTYVALLGLEQARRHLVDSIGTARKALADLDRAGLRTEFLSGLTDYLLARTS
jgi:geranylgeranyl diphosphate synthase, type II